MGMTEPPAKRPKTTSSSPRSIVTWNCNGLVSRCKYDSEELRRLLRETNEPDCICIQEARLKAASQKQRGKPLASEYEIVKPALTTVFGDNYDAYWSLADKRYAGTLTLLHKRLNFRSSVERTTTAFTPRAAIDVLCNMYGVTREQVGLPKAKVSPEKKVTQASMTSFFASKKKAPAAASFSTLAAEHNADGRFQFFFFPDLHLLQTYVPNNGTNEESFERRQGWDAAMLCFFQQREKILQHADVIAKHDSIPRLLWCGDTNCAFDYRDGTHWQQRQEGGSSSYYEWWTDESACLSKKPNTRNRSADDIGMPSFTPGERRRFGEIIKEAAFVDVWRELHPEGSGRTDLSQWDRPDWTWRGHLSTNGFSKYEGKGQRLDYFLLSSKSSSTGGSNKIADIVARCEILGYGAKREGLFCGSDHCASLLVLKEKKDEKTKIVLSRDV